MRIPISTISPHARCSVIWLLGALASPASHACHAPPREQLVTPAEQIALATDVSLARVVRATPSSSFLSGTRPPFEYEFEVQQRLLGYPVQRFVLVGAQGETRPAPPSDDHSDATFWQRGGGRLYNDPDCVLRPNFTVGETYLIFRNARPTWRSFEHIATVQGHPDPHDKWLVYVKENLANRGDRSAAP